MKDFGQWFAQSARETPAPLADVADQLELMGLDLMKDGSVIGKCSRCGEPICWTDYITIAEILRKGVGEELCGSGNSGCIP